MSISADIQKFDLNENDGNIYYFIKVFYNGREWGIRKRYSEFVRFNDILQRDYGIYIDYALPSKQFFKIYNKKDLMERKHLVERQKGLQLYLNNILKSKLIIDNNLIKEFLEVDHNTLEYRKKQSFHLYKKLVRMESFVTNLKDDMLSLKPLNPIYTSHSLNHNNNINNNHIQPYTFPNSPGGNNLKKTQSLSFSITKRISISSNDNSRRDSFQILDRRQSLDFSTSNKHNSPMNYNNYMKSNTVDIITLKSLLKTEAFACGVNALWYTFENDINLLFIDKKINQFNILLYNNNNNNNNNNNRIKENITSKCYSNYMLDDIFNQNIELNKHLKDIENELDEYFKSNNNNNIQTKFEQIENKYKLITNQLK